MERERAQADTPASQESQRTCEELQRWQKEDESFEQEGSKFPTKLRILRGGDLKTVGTTEPRWRHGCWTAGAYYLVHGNNTKASPFHIHAWALGKDVTSLLNGQILEQFSWPTLFKAVGTYCTSCIECQKASPGKMYRAPLIPMPIVAEPFHRIPMDIVGPL